MAETKLTKWEIRQRTQQLRSLLNDWDPIGVMDLANVSDEYDCMLGPVLSLLSTGGSESTLAQFLQSEVVGHFGLSPEYYDFSAVAARLYNWYALSWRQLGELETIYVSQLDEGTITWRPVQARQLSDPHLRRIVGVDADVSDETWEFPPGAVVRCELRRLSDGRSELAAVSLVGVRG